MKTVKERIREVVAEQLNISLIGEDDSESVEELGADSLHCVEIVAGLEEEFDIKIQDIDAENLTTVDNMATYLEALGVTD